MHRSDWLTRVAALAIMVALFACGVVAGRASAGPPNGPPLRSLERSTTPTTMDGSVQPAYTPVPAGGAPPTDLLVVQATQTFVLSNFPVTTDANGYTNLPEFSGSGDGVSGAMCSGASPVSGPNIPAQVITFLRPDLTHMRVLHNTGTPLRNANIRVNCTLTSA